MVGKTVTFKALCMFNKLTKYAKHYLEQRCTVLQQWCYKQIFNNSNLRKPLTNLLTLQELFLLNGMKLRIWSCRAVNHVYNFCTLSCNKAELLTICKCPIKSYLREKVYISEQEKVSSNDFHPFNCILSLTWLYTSSLNSFLNISLQW